MPAILRLHLSLPGSLHHDANPLSLFPVPFFRPSVISSSALTHSQSLLACRSFASVAVLQPAHAGPLPTLKESVAEASNGTLLVTRRYLRPACLPA
jgi:hypothetical protein